jgi:hypothetical protein
MAIFPATVLRTTKLANELLDVVKDNAPLTLVELISALLTVAHRTLILNRGEESGERFLQAMAAWQQQEAKAGRQ